MLVGTYQESQKHRHGLHAAITIVWFDKYRDRVAREEMRECKADGPTDDTYENGQDNCSKLAGVEYVLVHDENGGLDEPKTDNGDHIQRELRLSVRSVCAWNTRLPLTSSKKISPGSSMMGFPSASSG